MLGGGVWGEWWLVERGCVWVIWMNLGAKLEERLKVG